MNGMRNLFVLACVVVFMMCTCMTCDYYGPEVNFVNASDRPVMVRCHIEYKDSIPRYSVLPGDTVTIDYDMWFDNYRMVYVSVYEYRALEPESTHTWRPGANNPVAQDNERTWTVLKRYTLSRRFMETHGWTVTYGVKD